jgi:DNA-binding XRE family transcriptional regulator
LSFRGYGSWTTSPGRYTRRLTPMPNLNDAIFTDADSLKRLGGELARRRRESGFSQADLAIHAGVAKRSIERIETGDGSPRMETWIKVMRVLGYARGTQPEDLVPPTYEDIERAISHGSQHPILRQASILLYQLGRSAMGNPKLAPSWFTSAERALALQKELGGQSIDSPPQARLSALCEPVSVVTTDGDESQGPDDEDEPEDL